VVDEAVDDGDRHCLVVEYRRAPLLRTDW
jgi:hypothetical protein